MKKPDSQRLLIKDVVVLSMTLLVSLTVIRSLCSHHPKPAKRGATSYRTKTNYLHDGDILFQTSLSGQSKAIQLATHSHYSHCGLFFHCNGKSYVLEAGKTVRAVPLSEWIAHGKDRRYVVKRMSVFSHGIPEYKLDAMKKSACMWYGKPYDSAFNWDDRKMYCSELVWKIYQRGANIELCPLRRLKEYALNDMDANALLRKRYGNDIPWNETMVSPADVFDSDQLYEVFTHE